MRFSQKEIQTRKVLAIAALGVAGSLGVAACSTAAVPELLHSGTSAAPLRPPAAAAASSVTAREIARIAIGNGGLPALDQGDGQAYLATCDPGTVPNRPGGTSTSALCGIGYGDGSVWEQMVTVTFDSQGRPVADGTNLGTELLMPAAG